MTDYISREEFLSSKRRQYCENCNRRKGVKNGKTKTLYAVGDAPCRACEIGDMLDEIEDFPAADVRPVVHGHYIGEYDGYADGNPVYDMWYCSECGCCFEDWDEKPTYNFCPNCGADMRAANDRPYGGGGE